MTSKHSLKIYFNVIVLLTVHNIYCYQEHAWGFNRRYKKFNPMFSMMRIISYSVVTIRKMFIAYYNNTSVLDDPMK